MRHFHLAIFCFLVLGIYFPVDAFGGSDPGVTKFAENKGQWEKKINFKADIPSGELYLENNSLVYVFHDEAGMSRIHDIGHGRIPNPTEADFTVNGHCFKMHFNGANLNPNITSEEATVDYINYFLGNNPSKWATEVKQYTIINYSEIYNGIDYKLYSQEQQLKYDFVVKPFADPQLIQLEYEGLEEISTWYDELHLITSVNEIVEQKPFAYQVIDGKRVEVKCKFKLVGNTVSFEFPNGYDNTHTLVIDPVLIFSSYSGSTKDNWGYTATYDNAGNLYGGGIVLSSSPITNSTYPLVGAFQSSFGGGATGGIGKIDIGISKFSSDGSTLYFSTYLGGNGSDSPHSLVVNGNNELILMGSTSSSDFPTTNNAYDTSFNGGTTTSSSNINGSAASGSIHFSGGTDIVVTKFSASGASLIGSTYIGGTQNDGINFRTSPLLKNYGDDFRGEVNVDPSGNIYVASMTTSSVDFPIVNAFQNSFGGGVQDGCVFKLNPNLSSLIWSSYLGGSLEDACYSIALDASGNALIAGGTTSNNLKTSSTAINKTSKGGVDGFITKVNSGGDSIIACTYIGTNQYDQNYFVQLDMGDSVYVVGQTEGNYPSTPSGIFSQTNGGQYIHKLTPNLDSTVFSTKFGSNRAGQIDISLSAFLVNDCDHIYISGWGGDANTYSGYVPGSSTNNLLTTLGAHKTTTDGKDFYFIALAKNADSVIYATFFGGSGPSGEHADGGTSRFDKKGIIYQAVCAGCGGNSSFPTTQGAWAVKNGQDVPSVPGTNCNLGVIKFDMSKPYSDIQLSSPPYVCVPGVVNFGNKSIGTDFFWDFGDGNTSTDYAPVHMYTDTGTYEVMLIVSDSALCVTTDTSYVTIRGIPPPVADIPAPTPICFGDSIQLMATGGTSWQWYPALGLSNDTTQNPFAFPDSTTTYRLIVTDSCSSDTAFVVVEVNQDLSYTLEDTTICKGQSLKLEAGGGTSYVWTQSNGSLNNPTSPTPVASPTQTTAYFVEITDINGCVWLDTILVDVDPDLPVAKVSNDTAICEGGTAQLNANGGISFEWEPKSFLDNPNVSNPISKPIFDITYTVYVTNACGTVNNQVNIDVDRVEIASVGDSIACKGVPARLVLAGADFYTWEPAQYLNRNDISNPIAKINKPTLFTIHGVNSRGCSKDTSILLKLREPPPLEAGPDRIISWGSGVEILSLGKGSYQWTPVLGLDCDRCPRPIASPSTTTTYFVTLTDEYGCVANDSVTIIVSGSIFVPNTFTPNGDGHNDYFKAITSEIKEFYLTIYDRWGEIVFQTENPEATWDGTFNNQQLPIDSYVWKIRYIDYAGREGNKKGLVNLIR